MRVTDRQTDRRTEFSSLYRVCITCSAVEKTSRGRRKRLQPSVKGSPKFQVQHFVHKMMFSLTRLSSLVFLVCLLATSCKNYWPDFRENFTKGLFLDRRDITLNFETNPPLDMEIRKVKKTSTASQCLLFTIANRHTPLPPWSEVVWSYL